MDVNSQVDIDSNTTSEFWQKLPNTREYDQYRVLTWMKYYLSSDELMALQHDTINFTALRKEQRRVAALMQCTDVQLPRYKQKRQPLNIDYLQKWCSKLDPLKKHPNPGENFLQQGLDNIAALQNEKQKNRQSTEKQKERQNLDKKQTETTQSLDENTFLHYAQEDYDYNSFKRQVSRSLDSKPSEVLKLPPIDENSTKPFVFKRQRSVKFDHVVRSDDGSEFKLPEIQRLDSQSTIISQVKKANVCDDKFDNPESYMAHLHYQHGQNPKPEQILDTILDEDDEDKSKLCACGKKAVAGSDTCKKCGQHNKKSKKKKGHSKSNAKRQNSFGQWKTPDSREGAALEDSVFYSMEDIKDAQLWYNRFGIQNTPPVKEPSGFLEDLKIQDLQDQILAKKLKPEELEHFKEEIMEKKLKSVSYNMVPKVEEITNNDSNSDKDSDSEEDSDDDFGYYGDVLDNGHHGDALNKSNRKRKNIYNYPIDVSGLSIGDVHKTAYLRALNEARFLELPDDPEFFALRLTKPYSFSYHSHIPNKCRCEKCKPDEDNSNSKSGKKKKKSAGKSQKTVIGMKAIFGKVKVDDFYPGGKKNPVRNRRRQKRFSQTNEVPDSAISKLAKVEEVNNRENRATNSPTKSDIPKHSYSHSRSNSVTSLPRYSPTKQFGGQNSSFARSRENSIVSLNGAIIPNKEGFSASVGTSNRLRKRLSGPEYNHSDDTSGYGSFDA